MENDNTQNASVKGFTNLLDALVEKNLITKDQFNAIKFESINSGKSFEDVIISKGILPELEIVKVLAEMRGMGFVDLRNISIPVETLQTLNKEIAEENLAVVFENLGNNKVKVAMKDPLDLQKIKYLESSIGKKIESYYATEEAIRDIIDTRYGAQIGSEVDEALQEIADPRNYSSLGSSDLETDSGAAPIIRIVNMILEYAIKHRASDVHIEPRDNKISVRFRIRGILTEKLTIPKKLLPAVVTRIKILSSLKIDEHRIPQDGRFQINSEQDQVDIRVSIMPSVHGEKVVMRILEKSQGIMPIEQTGIRGLSMKRLRDSLQRTQGIILVTGPTGSGKTQTLASSLKILNSPEVNIITLEDPVEIKIDGVNQTQVNPDVGLTFATGLRSILRQDPDVIMVGEIRDAETAKLAVQAALVGRLVLSTVHTNSAAGAFVRLLDMGIEPFLLTSTVNSVVGQRLVRVLCECKKPYKAPATAVATLHEELDSLQSIDIHLKEGKSIHFDKDTSEVTLYEPVGCPKCNGAGFVDRTGIFEVLVMSDKIRELVMERNAVESVQKIAINEGMITMVQDGFIKVLEGITTLEEVLRVKNE